jgi:hypothetical protein
MSAAPLKLIITTPEFFSTPPKNLVVEDNEIANRTYFLKGDRIVAVGIATLEGHRQ